MTSIEAQLAALENEARALKAASEQSATTLPVYTSEAEFSTSQNQITTKYATGNSYTEDGVERVLVSFDTKNGINTIAALELETSSPYAPTIRRVPYTGGAQWIIATQPDISSGTWQPTNYRLQVLSLVDGSLRAEDYVS